MSDPVAERVLAVSDAVTKLTLGRVGLAFLAIIGAILGYSAFENRAAIISTIMTNPPIGISVAIGILISIVGFIFRALLNRIEELNAARIVELSTRLKQVEEELVKCRVDCKEEAVQTHLTIVAALSRIEDKLHG